MSTRHLLFGVSLCLALPVLVPAEADARRVISDDKKKNAEKEKEKPKEKPEEKKPKETAKEKKARLEAEKKAKEAEEKAAAEKKADEQAAKERKEREKELAEEAAERAAEEAKRKKEEDKRKAEEEKRRKVEEKREANKAGRLKAAKSLRTLTRRADERVVTATLTPGAPRKDKVLEVRLDVGQMLKVASARYGKSKPLKNLDVLATISGPGGEKTYVVHPLSAAGAYGFHTTPEGDGEHTVVVKAKGIDMSFPVHVGVWPPPDFEDEEKNNAAADAAGTGRRIVK